MERKERKVSQDGTLYDCLFETPPGIDETVKSNANLSDTIKMLPEKVWAYNHQAKKISAVLNDLEGDVTKTCKNIWSFLTKFIAYKPDQKGKEQVRSVWRLWRDRLGDCDCFSFFTSSILTILNVPHKFRITEYPKKSPEDAGGFQHIYVVVPNKGKEIIIDAVLPEFNYEHPYLNKIDKAMELQFLNGISPVDFSSNGKMGIDADDLLSGQLPTFDDSVDGIKDALNKLKDKAKTVVSNVKEKVQATTQNVKEAAKKVGETAKKGLHAVNKINPATATLRLGILTGMKTNLFGVAGNLRFTYLSDAEAQKRGMNMKRLVRARNVRAKIERIFYGAGGQPENLKEAILTGKGNNDKSVTLSGFDLAGVDYANAYMVRDIVGGSMYADEIPAEELSGLGEVITATAIAAASGLLATITGILKNIGPLFEKGEPGPDKGMEELDRKASESGVTETPNETTDPPPEPDGGNYSDSSGSKAPEPSGEEQTEKPFFERAKEWVENNKTTVIITAVSVAAVAGGILWYRKSKNSEKEKSKGSRAEVTNGIPGKTKSNVKVHGNNRSKRNEKILRELKLSRMT